jgi:hypothetical protein
MRLVPAALAVALTPAFIAVPTVAFDFPDPPHPVSPKVVSTAIKGVDPGELAGSARPLAVTGGPVGLTPKMAVAVLTPKMAVARFTVAGVAWSRTSVVAATDVTVNVRVNEASGWTAWETVAITDDGPDPATAEAARARVGTTPLVSDGATGIQVRVDTTTGATPPGLLVSTIDPGTSPADDDLTPAAPAGSASAAASQPAIITRAQWGADEKLRKTLTLNASVKAITIHHTAGSNSYTQAEAAAQVRGIYAYDTLALGWADIAYNFLVDKWGRVYEGRAGSITSAVRGAHAMGFNTDTMGVSAMGNYETTAAPAVMVDALARVAGWKLSQYGVNPLGKVVLTSQGGVGAKYAAGVAATLDTIHAHQNSSYTLCPGKYLYPQMGAIRAKAANYASYSSTAAPTADPPGTRLSDLNSDGRSDLVARDSAGRLWLYPGNGSGGFLARRSMGGGWKSMTAIITPGDVNGDGRGDVLARGKAGQLWFYPGNGASRLSARRLAGAGGWNSMTALTAAGNMIGNARPDMLARDKAGRLWLYPSTGAGTFGTRHLLGRGGWNAMTAIAGAGDLSGDGRADLLARDRAGTLWLYRGNGGGGFGARTLAGHSWNGMTALVTPGNFDRAGGNDLIARDRAGRLWLYPGNNAGRFGSRRPLGTGFRGYFIA